jgi:hypothetical protein
MANNRRRGHQMERDTVIDLRPIFPKVTTSRNASKLLDDSKVDIANIPLRIQCKLGYKTNRPKFDLIKKECDELCQKNFLKSDPIIDTPFLLRHKLERNDMLTMEWKFFLILLESYVSNNKEKFENYI